MENQGGFIKDVVTNTNNWYKVGLQQIEWQKKIQGTKCMVTRLSKSSKYKDVFGSIASSTVLGDVKKEEFPYVVLINLNDMLKLYQKSLNQLDFYDNESILKLGDVLSFSSAGQVFRFKIIDIQTFSETGFILNRYTISGFTEVNSEKELD
jgi:hypothetical protein